MIHRHAVVTASSVAVILLAGGTATALNLGVLEPTEASNIGSASADAVSRVVEPTSDEPAPAAQSRLRRFKVGAAGIITAGVTTGTLEVTDVSPSPGWTARTDRLTADSVVVTFVGNGAVVTAELSVVDGNIVVESDELVTTVDSSANGSGAVSADTVGTSSPASSGSAVAPTTRNSGGAASVADSRPDDDSAGDDGQDDDGDDDRVEDDSSADDDSGGGDDDAEDRSSDDSGSRSGDDEHDGDFDDD